MELKEKIDSIIADKSKTFKVSPRELINAEGYQRRSWGICQNIVRKLAKQELELSGDPYKEWIDAEIVLQHKAVATSKVTADAVRRVSSLEAAHQKPMYVDRNDTLETAVTLMHVHNYSQLPVVSGGERTLIGHISWKSIGLALWKGVKTDSKVQEYMVDKITTIKRDEPLLSAIKIIAENKFVVVVNKDKSLEGIITTADIASEFFSITQAEAFLLLEQIELQIRTILNKADILLEDLKKCCVQDGRDIQSIDDLTFGEYIKIIENPKVWKKLNIRNDQSSIVKYLNQVREVRNDVMHFEPDGIGADKMLLLRNIANYLSEI